LAVAAPLSAFEVEVRGRGPGESVVKSKKLSMLSGIARFPRFGVFGGQGTYLLNIRIQVQQEKIIRENRFQGGRKSALCGTGTFADLKPFFSVRN